MDIIKKQCPSAFRSDDEETSVCGQVKKGKLERKTNDDINNFVVMFHLRNVRICVWGCNNKA